MLRLVNGIVHLQQRLRAEVSQSADNWRSKVRDGSTTSFSFVTRMGEALVAGQEFVAATNFVGHCRLGHCTFVLGRAGGAVPSGTAPYGYESLMLKSTEAEKAF
jgi:hypothetical protein